MKMRTAIVAGMCAVLPFICLTNASAGDDVITAAAKSAETRLDARVGLAIYDTGGDRTWFYNADERFPMASTFKALACAALLNAGNEISNSTVTITEADVQSYAPVTKTMVGKRVSSAELCEITLRTSDNTAANKVLDVLGGPPAVTSFLRSLGDRVTRLDRIEPELNEGSPGDPRDSTTPRAMADTIQKLILGNALEDRARIQLTEWLVGNEVGGPLLRAGIPTDWKIADRTGAGGFGTRGIIAVMWPPARDPIVAAIYVAQTEASMEDRNEAIADIGRAIASLFSN
ncbi:class A beta-lactamase [Ensifer aridi]|uniref:class A beta-lactamase n=1 Tax=Ensifer aridi TaxID=1708715 RepID=UPI00041B345A|nr:class A beta-lactamase [Ensifer aridi]